MSTFQKLSSMLFALILFCYFVSTGHAQGPVDAKCTAPGGVSQWTETTKLDSPLADSAVTGNDKFLYVVGGGETFGSFTSTVRYAPINQDGTLGNWQITEPISNSKHYMTSAISGSLIYAIGGYDGGNIETSKEVEYATINADGSLTPWQQANRTTARHIGSTAVISGEYIYAVGGFGSDTTERAFINQDGSLGPWEIVDPTLKNYPRLGDFYYRYGGGFTERSTDGISWQPVNFGPKPYEPGFGGVGNFLYLVGGGKGDGTEFYDNVYLLDTTTPTWPSEYGLSINDDALFTNQVTTTLTIGQPPTWGQLMQVSNGGGFVGAQWESYSPCKSWTITQYGAYVLPRTVYVRFKDPTTGQVSSTYPDDIIYDPNPPDPGQATLTDGAQSASAAAIPPAGLRLQVAQPADTGQVQEQATRLIYLPLITAWQPPANATLHLSATDDVSGVGTMQISADSGFSGVSWESYRTVKPIYLPAGQGTVWVRFRDWAGNVSRTISAKR